MWFHISENLFLDEYARRKAANLPFQVPKKIYGRTQTHDIDECFHSLFSRKCECVRVDVIVCECAGTHILEYSINVRSFQYSNE